ncbi:MAG: phosphoglycolate phosphatase-like HAD superfamily hydrolase [Patiriisocius sp.]|jgi:phosphoglycolate phosphatase-like HAD superfamily hydrolase
MKFILDFDGVLFNTEALKIKMADAGLSSEDRDVQLLDRVIEDDQNFIYSSLVFSDAHVFLLEHGADCVVVSSAQSSEAKNNTDTYKQIAYQSAKIERSGVAALVSQVQVVACSKAEVLQTLQAQYNTEETEFIFIDDRMHHIEVARLLGITAVHMDRAGNGEVTNFEEI